MQNKEIVIFHVHNEDQFYILHGTQCRNLDICKFQDFCIIQTNSRFKMMQRIEKLTIENLQILHDAKCRQFHFCEDKFNISHVAKYRSFDS